MGIKQRIGKALGPPNLDEVLMVCRVIGDRPGTMVDVGAHHGYALEPFLDQGWVVHAFEPDPANRAILSSRCPGALIDPRAVSETDGEEVSLFTSDVSTGISTLSPFHTTHAVTATVQTVRLDTYLKEQDVQRVDFLKVDIEGFDLFALRSFPWDTHQPKAVVCEFEDHKTTRLGHTVHDIAKFLQNEGYAVIVSEWEPITEYGVNHAWKRFVRYPVTLSQDGWGNLIAVQPHLVEAFEQACRSTERRLRVRRLVDWVRGR
ncbi:FkbM family methyltransferase [Mycolicibacterium litorale]|uniref:FkbM family methyltransferase n=1 Tax=Mycolicibacterium litorale TaxID=758802 RepID=UPI0039A38374